MLFKVLAVLSLSAFLAISLSSMIALNNGQVAASVGASNPMPMATLSETVRFAVIGDYGTNNQAEINVARRVLDWNPDFIVTVGDNNYPDGKEATFTANVLNHYGSYISADPAQNRFYPALGNHDWNDCDTSPGAVCEPANTPYLLKHFTLPTNPAGNERYYDFVQGAVHFLIVDSDPHEPDGITAGSIQGAWLEKRLKESTARWQMVFMHHPPHSSGQHGSTPALQWPYQEWGADVVFAGHEHSYERILLNGLPYFVNGAAGAGLRTCRAVLVAGSRICDDVHYGAMLVEATTLTATFKFISAAGELIDSYRLPEPPVLERQVAQSSDDGEERPSDGFIYLTSSDLELTRDPDPVLQMGNQVVGIRFQNVTVPRQATIHYAYLEFSVKEVTTGTTSLTIHAQAADSASTFISSTHNISLRPLTNAAIDWRTIPSWTTLGAAQRTPDLTALVQEIVNRPGWQSGNALAFIIDGEGRRVVESFDKAEPRKPALLHIEYQVNAPAPTPTNTPVITLTPIVTPTATLTPTTTPANQQVFLPVVEK